MARGDTVTLREITLWNGVGFADLVHVLALGATTLAGFYASHPAILPLNLLPLVGVPVFMAAHVMSLWGLSSAKNINAHQRNPQDKGH